MPTYVLPQVQVFQDFTVSPSAAANPLRAHISGGHAQLIRYGVADERANGLLGTYDRVADTDYDWPHRPAGGIVDTGYVKVWMKNALLRYFYDAISASSTITKVSGSNNQIKSATVNFIANGDDYPRAAALLDRDVKVGDVAKVRGINGDGDSVTLWTTVKRIVADVVATSIAAASSDSSNAASQAASASYTQIAGDINCVTLTLGGAYVGHTSGYVTETYDLLVVDGTAGVDGGGGTDYSSAVLRVISGSGTDNVAAVSPNADGTMNVGTRGLTVAFGTTGSAACSASAASEGITASDLIAGQRWRITVNQLFTAPTPTSGGAYTGSKDTTYIVTVTRGGLFTDTAAPQITVTTSTGIDLSGPTSITDSGQSVAVGTLGVTISFAGTALRKGDRYYVDVTGKTSGAYRTIELAHNLDTTIAGGSEVELSLFILKSDLQISANRTNFAPATNWTTSAAQITINSGIVAYDESWTDSGVEQALDVYSDAGKGYGSVYVETRYWLPTLAGDVYSVSDPADLDTAISGDTDPDNPLKWGVKQALANSNGTAVKFTAVADPNDDDSWVATLAKLVGRDDIYHLVPLTRSKTVLDLYEAHVNAMSSPTESLWRVLWTNLAGVPEIPLVSAGSSVPGHLSATTTDLDVCLCVVEDDPDTAGTQYTIVRCPAGNSAFVTNGVRAGDIVRLLYTSDGFGNETYSEYVVDEVQSEDQLRLLTGPAMSIGVASKTEVWRTLDATAEAAAIAANAGAFGNRRVRAVWPDQIESSGTVMEGYFLCCTLAGLCSGVLPHQGLTHLEISGYTSVPRTTAKFNRSQLDAMALAGVWIVTQDLTGLETDVGQIYTRHAVTTGGYSNINDREEVAVRNVDSISYRFHDFFKPFIGVTNVTPVIQARLKLEAENLIGTLKTENDTQDLGPQLIAGTIVSLQPSATSLDRYVMKINITIPYPLNTLEIHLMI